MKINEIRLGRAKLGAFCFIYFLVSMLLCCPNETWAREMRYDGKEEVVYVNPGEATQITFPSKISSGFKNKGSKITLDKQDNYLIIYADPTLGLEGEVIVVQIDDKRTYSIRIMPASQEAPRDDIIVINDTRPPVEDTEQEQIQMSKPSAVTELMKALILIAEFGRQKGIPGYRRSNQYSGETILHDGTMKVTIDEIFMGSNLWGYVLTAENMLDTTQKINPATFRLDGTRAVIAQRWELAPQPQTPEQDLAKAHIAKIYVVTKSKRR
ncbi:MAG: type-F conjugative transfer system secretin TraK [Deltaproteobacteria bacterium]|nr:type-F conjugative transfer system secretin TraK [Deltaproteobacteria bacterium]